LSFCLKQAEKAVIAQVTGSITAIAEDKKPAENRAKTLEQISEYDSAKNDFPLFFGTAKVVIKESSLHDRTVVVSFGLGLDAAPSEAMYQGQRREVESVT
jgi:hypothetical protein